MDLVERAAVLLEPSARGVGGPADLVLNLAALTASSDPTARTLLFVADVPDDVTTNIAAKAVATVVRDRLQDGTRLGFRIGRAAFPPEGGVAIISPEVRRRALETLTSPPESGQTAANPWLRSTLDQLIVERSIATAGDRLREWCYLHLLTDNSPALVDTVVESQAWLDLAVDFWAVGSPWAVDEAARLESVGAERLELAANGDLEADMTARIGRILRNWPVRFTIRMEGESGWELSDVRIVDRRDQHITPRTGPTGELEYPVVAWGNHRVLMILWISCSEPLPYGRLRWAKLAFVHAGAVVSSIDVSDKVRVADS